MELTSIPKATKAARADWRDYLNLTKPRVISLLLLTTLAAMLIAGEGIPALATISVTLLGGYLAAGGAGALNCYLDADIDAMMNRTRRRPLPSQRISGTQALAFGSGLSILSFLVLWWGANLAAALLAAGGILFYIFIYTLWLKRRSPHNIVIGGAAGAFPPLVGWAAVTGSLSLTAVLLFIIIFVWTPPHFWALALVLRADYQRAGVPMLPVVAGNSVTHTQIVRYVVLLALITFLPVLLGSMGFIYATAALLLNAVFIYQARQLRQRPVAWRLYKFSLLYLALLFAAMVVDHLLAVS
jgi:heme o synthase